MNSNFLIALPFLAFFGALMFLLPQFSPRRFFFAITVPAGFRSSAEARAIARRYHRWMAIALFCGVALVAVAAPEVPDWAVILAVFLPMIAGFILFLMGRSQVRHYAAAPNDVREAELTAEGDQVPRWALWALPPFAAPLATAQYLHQHWNQIPARFPAHLDLQGNVNGWSARTPQGVYGVLAGAAGIMVLLLLVGIGLYYGSRRAPQRAAVLKMLICTMYYLALLFAWIGLMPLLQISVVWLLISSVAFSVGIVVWSFKLVTDPRMPAEATPDDCWYLGGIYCNRHDPAIFVQKRIGFGYTLNLGNRVTWLLMGGLLAGIFGVMAVVKL
ncbi:membrane hypothetical protein [Candidatus Sulfopaludibacter sp. SbA3]|nr:membrane hypothetical protein [Candidatus Sulfopaludibacter sp. SbA3]